GRADLVERHRERPLPLVAAQRRDLAGVAVGDDAGDAAGVGEPAQMRAVGRLVDREVGLEGQNVGGHHTRERHHAVTSLAMSLEDTTRPKARPMMSSVARWISGQSVATASSATVTRYSRLHAPTTLARTQMSVSVPVTTSDVTPRARSAPSSGVPWNPSYQCLRTTSSSGRGASAGIVSALGCPSRQFEDGQPEPGGGARPGRLVLGMEAAREQWP